MELLWVAIYVSLVILLVSACRTTEHPARIDWFQLLPHLHAEPLSKKYKGRQQQKRS